MLAFLFCVLCQAEPKVDKTSLEYFVAGAVAEQKLELAARVSKLEQTVKRARGPAAASARRQLVAAKAAAKKPPFPPRATMMRMDSPPGTVGELSTPFRDDIRNVRTAEIIQVLSDSELLCQSDGGGIFILKGKSTAGKVDEEHFHLDSIYETAGTEKYTTVLGAGKTVAVFKYWKHEAAFKALKDEDRDKFIKPEDGAAKQPAKKPSTKK